MKERVIRLRIPEDVFLKYRMLCFQLDLSLPKQTTLLIKSFVDVTKANYEFINVKKDEK